MTYINTRQQQAAPAPASAPSPQGGVQGADMILWAAAQSEALSKLQIFSTMAKQVNDQQ
ncbi:hypothetical protein AAKU55_003611 [Oxalobacteraceae bacterium GrIS 1.11]